MTAEEDVAPVQEPLPHRPPRLILALQRVLSPSGFPYGSNYRLFRDAQFGRDSLEVAEDLLSIRPSIAQVVIPRLAELQGQVVDPRTEEEPGKIHHEHRALIMDGRPVGREAVETLHLLARHWGIAADEEEANAMRELTYYGTVDATPLYVRLVGRYCAAYGRSILDRECTPRRWTEGQPRTTVRESVRRAVEWIVGKLERSNLGLLEFERMTSRGPQFQAWKDGGTSYLHPDGTFANYNGPIASIEVQGLAYDALTEASVLLDDVTGEQRRRWRDLADRVQETVMKRFWMPHERYFAMAIDRDPANGEPRQVQLITSNPGALLDSGIWDSLSAPDRRRFVSAIVERIYSAEFLTLVGIRCNSVIHKDLQDYPAYQSSHTVWHKETYDIAKGLRRHGFSRLADDLENRLLNGVNVSGGPTEFLYVFPDGRVVYDPFNRAGKQNADEIPATNVPENDQAWSISAALASKWRRGRRRLTPAPEGSWQREREADLLRRHPPVSLLRTVSEVEAVQHTPYCCKVNTEKGLARERAFIASHRL